VTSNDPILLALDFDNTIARTFEQSFGLRNVQTAYEYAIQDVFGDDGVALYRAQGGLNNRAPTEIVLELGAPADQVIALTDTLVQRKLSYLLPEIGTPLAGGGAWPRLCAGLDVFWHSAREQRQFHLALVSNGHREFIERVFRLHHLELPEIMITDDDVRRRTDLEPRQRYKPDPAMLKPIAERLSINPHAAIYIGDNLALDGVMAKNAGMRFGHFDSRFGRRVERLNGGFRFGDWRELIPLLPGLKV
jgi:phosphoglycolate phosphatase-like HAD superfamily hydrolase